MTKARSLALVCAGPISRNGIARLPKIIAQLGPVKSGTLQRASRAVNALGGGAPVAEYQAIADSQTILVNVPDDQLPGILGELAGTGIDWTQKIAILCNSSLGSGELTRLESQGAAVGSFDAITGFEDLRYVIEGNDSAVREMRALIEQGDVRAIEIRQGAKKQYLAGITFATDFLASTITGAVDCLRDSGLPIRYAHQIAATLVEKTLRDFLKSGAKALPGSSEALLGEIADGLQGANPRLARYFRKTAVQTAEYATNETPHSSQRLT